MNLVILPPTLLPESAFPGDRLLPGRLSSIIMLISQEKIRRIKIKTDGLWKREYHLPLQLSPLIQSKFVSNIRSDRQHFLYFLHAGKNSLHSNHLTSKHSDISWCLLALSLSHLLCGPCQHSIHKGLIWKWSSEQEQYDSDRGRCLT